VKITQEEVVERQTVLHIELEEEDLNPYLDRGYRRVVKHTMIPGFRKGKAPRIIVERYVGRESLLHEVMDFMLPEVTAHAISAQDLDATGTPRLELLEMEPVTLKATVALTPLVELGDYRDIRIEEEPVEITEDDVQEQLQELLKASASWEPVERPVKMGDMVTMSVIGSVEEVNILDKEDEVYIVDEERALPFPGFAQQLEGVVVSAPKEFDLKISENHADARLAGKDAHFEITVGEVKERVLPELDDEFAKSVDDGYDSLAALRQAIEKDLDQKAHEAQAAQYREAALEELQRVGTVELPPLLIEHEVEHMVDRRDRLVDQLNIRKDDYLRLADKTEEEIQEEMRENAEKRLTRSFILATLAESEGLEISPEEIDEKIQAITASGDREVESILERDPESEEVRSAVRETLLVGKALDRLTAIARGEASESGDVEQSVASQDQDSDKLDQDSEEGGDTVDVQT
jgi:trigger factor